MTADHARGGPLKDILGFMLIGAVIVLTAAAPSSAQDKPKADAKDQKKPDAKPQPKDQKKTEAKPQPQPEKKAEVKPMPAPAQPQPNPNDPAKLKEQITTLQKEVAALKLKVATLELEKLGAMVSIDKAKDGKETATVNILKKWSGDKDAMQLLKNVPNLQVVYIDNGQVNDAAIAPLKESVRLECAHVDEPSVY